MKELTITIQNPTGLHARPAKIFVNTAKQFKSDIRVQHGAKKANAKSLISMLTLGVEAGSEIRILVDGADEDEAMMALETAVSDGLGESEHIEATHRPTNKPTNQPTSQQPTRSQQQDEPNSRHCCRAGHRHWPRLPTSDSLKCTIEETFAGASAEANPAARSHRTGTGPTDCHLRKQMLARGAASEADIFDVHLEILDDPDLLDAVLAKINSQQQRRAGVAGHHRRSRQTRWPDWTTRCWRLVRPTCMTWATACCACWWAQTIRAALPEHPVIILAQDLSPSDTASLRQGKSIGLLYGRWWPHRPFRHHRPRPQPARRGQRRGRRAGAWRWHTGHPQRPQWDC